MKILWKMTFASMLTVMLNQIAFAEKLEGDALRKNVTERLPQLNHTKLEALMQRVGKKAPKNFYNCLCRQDGGGAAIGVGVSYHPEALKPYNEKYSCNRAGPPCMAQGYGCWRFPLPSDAKMWNYCIEHHKYDDNSSIVDAIVGEIEVLHIEQKQITYKKLCDEAKIMFPLAHKKYLNNQTKILWDKKMLAESFKNATKLYEKESENKISLNTKFWHANTYLLWLFGHGQNQFGGTFISKDDAKKVSDIQVKESEFEVSKYKLKAKENSFRKLSGAEQSDIRVIEKFWKEKEVIKKEISKKEKELKYYKFLKNRKGYEPALLKEMIQYQKDIGKKLTPGDVLYLSLKQRDGKLNEALLLAHNTLRAIARPGEGNFAVTGVEGDLNMYKTMFVDLREGDNAGPWYHIFGTGFYNVQQKAENLLVPSSIGSAGTNALEQFYREIKGGRVPDPEKFCFNAWGAEVSGDLFNEYKLGEVVLKEAKKKDK